MPNQLFLPFKVTWDIDIKSAVCAYLQDQTDAHPDAFKWDIGRWKALRKEGVGGVVRTDRIPPTLNYHAQLLSILSKLPVDIQLEIPYAPAFYPSEPPIKLNNIAFERAAVLFNLAALYSQLATAEDRSTREGVRRAISSYQNAAGTLSYLLSAAIPKSSFAPSDEDIPWDLTEPFVRSLELLMLAQAQECVWQRAVMDSYKDGLIAKLAASAASLYCSSRETVYNASSIRDKFPSSWLSHIEAKQCHFYAAAQLRKSADELEGNRYGIELARLTTALVEAKKGYNLARRAGVAPAVFQDVKSLLDIVQKTHGRAERDNDLIYHHDVPAASALDAIHETCMVKSTVLPGLADPQSAMGDEKMLFGDLLGWGARQAINVYSDNKRSIIKEIVDLAKHLNDSAAKALRSLNLPSSLEALDTPIGLPPSLLQKAEEVRIEEGPTRIETSIEDVQRLAQHDMDILDEAMDILDHEASEDEAVRMDGVIQRPPSHDANKELVSKGQKYRNILEQAETSDELVRRKWDEWEGNIRELTWDNASQIVTAGDRLSNSVPSSTGSNTSNFSQSHVDARALRTLLESLKDIKGFRDQIVERAQRQADNDSIQSQVLEAVNGFGRGVEVKADMFEDIADDELAKYDKFLKSMSESEKEQNTALAAIEERNTLFLQSRRDDLSVKERAHALQSLDLAYQKYREITHNLDEGLKFYNELAGILTEFRESCKSWSSVRQQEIPNLSRRLQSTSLHNVHEGEPIRHQNRRSPPGPQHLLQNASTVARRNPPSLTSDEWEAVELPPGPPDQTPRAGQANRRIRNRQ